MGYNNSFGELHETATKIYTLKLPPVYKETKVYIKCYLFRFLSSIYKVVQVQRIQHTARASNQLFPRFLFVLYDCTRYIFQLSVLLYKGTCYQLLQLLQLLPEATVYPQESLSITRTRDSAACYIITHSPCRCWVSKDTLVFVVTTTPLFLH